MDEAELRDVERFARKFTPIPPGAVADAAVRVREAAAFKMLRCIAAHRRRPNDLRIRGGLRRAWNELRAVV